VEPLAAAEALDLDEVDRIRVTGPRELVRAFLSWGPLSRFADVRPAQGTAATVS